MFCGLQFPPRIRKAKVLLAQFTSSSVFKALFPKSIVILLLLLNPPSPPQIKLWAQFIILKPRSSPRRLASYLPIGPTPEKSISERRPGSLKSIIQGEYHAQIALPGFWNPREATARMDKSNERPPKSYFCPITALSSPKSPIRGTSNHPVLALGLKPGNG